MNTLELYYKELCEKKTDINEHLPRLLELGKRCNSITEFGTRTGRSTIAWLMAKPVKLTCYDIKPRIKYQVYKGWADFNKIDFKVFEKDVLTIDIEDTDLLFIDTYHTYGQLSAELTKHGEKARKYIILHDTETFRSIGEDRKKPGLGQAITEFLKNRERWEIRSHYRNNNGLTILQRAKEII